MNNRTHLIGRPSTLLILVLCLAAASAAGTPLAEGGEEAKQWVCPPCGDAHCDTIYSQGGSCPVCGMALVEKTEGGLKGEANVAILIFDGVQIIDYTGPYEVFGQAGFNVFTVSPTGETITTNMGMSVNPTYSLANSPEAEILLVPGGSVQATYDDPKVIEWLKKRSAAAQHVLTVCNGAFILAKTGLLDGRSATTFYGLIDELKEFAPKVRVVDDQRYVDNGKIVTSAGLSSGIDAALYLVSKIRGMGRAEAVALNMEYDWRPDSTYARGAFADRKMPDLDFPAGVRLRTVKAGGDRERWEAQFSVQGEMSAAEALAYLNRELARLDNWKRTGDKAAAGNGRSTWRFTDDEGGVWICETYLGSGTPEEDGPTVAYTLHKAGGAERRAAQVTSE
ncbi:MAG TPA: DJ-1/PfpI family protein [Candidatus Polarisedimenticolia bacterium]|nr:DJ-1/PfpI family protein [Candidatus Polarisedimenticolia bacterium]